MNKLKLESDNTLAAMSAWNVLTELLGGEAEDKFDDLDKFSSFYSLVVSKLHEAEEDGE